MLHEVTRKYKKSIIRESEVGKFPKYFSPTPKDFFWAKTTKRTKTLSMDTRHQLKMKMIIMNELMSNEKMRILNLRSIWCPGDCLNTFNVASSLDLCRLRLIWSFCSIKSTIFFDQYQFSSDKSSSYKITFFFQFFHH